MSDQDQPIITPYGTTPGGLPVPADTDLVMAGAQAMTALAQAIDARPRLRARKAGTYNIAGNANDIEQGSGSAVWDLFETNYNNQGDTVGMVAPYAGYYWCMASAAMLWPANVTDQTFGCKIVNVTNMASATPTEALHDQKLVRTGTGGGRQTTRVANLLKAAAGDLLRMSVHQNTGSTQTLGGPTADWMTRLAITYIGP